jgi:hypothetical protein
VTTYICMLLEALAKHGRDSLSGDCLDAFAADNESYRRGSGTLPSQVRPQAKARALSPRVQGAETLLSSEGSALSNTRTRPIMRATASDP